MLAGGRGERLGLGVPKALATLDGDALVDRAARTLAVLCDEVAIVAPAPVSALLAPRPCLADAAGFEGPLAGLLAALELAGARECLVLGVDLPFVTAALVAELAARRRASGALVALAAPEDVPQPLVAAFAPGVAPRVRAALERGVRALREGIQELEPLVLRGDEALALPGGEAARS